MLTYIKRKIKGNKIQNCDDKKSSFNKKEIQLFIS